MKAHIVVLVSLLALPSWATNYTVKAGGGGSFTTMAACAAQMNTNGTGVSDTCTVFSGTYSETVTIPSGSANNYKIFNVNGSDVVSVLAFIAGSHVKIVGNCTVPAAVGTCGFSIQNLSSPGARACVALGTSTDVYVTNNSAANCGAGLASVPSSCGTGAISAADTSSFIYIQGNTIAYPSGPVGGPVGIGILLGLGQNAGSSANHFLVENNDISHYALGIKYGSQFAIIRNNTFHDQLETEGCENQHTDMTFSEQTVNVAKNVIEGNLQRNAVGANAKGNLAQGDTPCTGCTNLIIRFNIVSGIDGSGSSNYGTWPHIVQYNNTKVDLKRGSSLPDDTDFNDSTLTSTALLNTLYYYNNSSSWSNWNSGSCGASCNAGHNLYWCVGTCASPYNHIYGGSGGLWAVDSGNLHSDPKFVSYVSAGSASNNYHLQAGSPAIAAGTNLTTVNGTIASSTALVVTDATYFQDGYGLSNANSTVSPDCVSVTTVGNHVCITAVNYSTNTLTLASPISATNGDAVWLYSKSDGVQVLTGTAPDMGALPFSSATASPTPAPAVGMFAELRH